jgi:hypothetical protein
MSAGTMTANFLIFALTLAHSANLLNNPALIFIYPARNNPLTQAAHLLLERAREKN